MDAIAALGLKFKPLIIQITGFLILFWILKKYLFGRILGMIQHRSAEISRAYEQNEKAAEEAWQPKEQYAQQLAEVREQADGIIQEATKKAAEAGQEILEKTRREAEQLRDKRLAELEQEKEHADENKLPLVLHPPEIGELERQPHPEHDNAEHGCDMGLQPDEGLGLEERARGKEQRQGQEVVLDPFG